jgi:hypothetical protein
VNILDQYVTSAPSAQNALDIFADAWVSKLPQPLEALQAGTVPLFDDIRIPWAVEQLGDFKGRTVLELGSLEGGHTYQLDRLGASAILAIEANTSAYMRSLIVKELLDIRHARFVCGDFVAFLRENQQKFDVCFASGVLYHMRNPAELIALLSRATDRVLLWTHYYDRDIIIQRPDFGSRFPDIPPQPAEYQGFIYQTYRHQYQGELDMATFCGGSAPYSNWMARDDILACLRYFGFDQLRVGLENREHGGGPSFTVAAIRSGSKEGPSRSIAETVAPEDNASVANPASALLDESFTQPQVKSDFELLRERLKPLEATVQRQDQRINVLETEMQRKNQHITDLETLIARIESGRIMRLLRRLKV